ncbi:Strictosidine synthase, partial [Thalictrum thalictroides]
DHLRIAANGDSTGRLMTYDPVSRKVTVLLKGLSFANGVALSKDRDYVLVAETSRQLIQRYWLKGLQATTHEVFAQVPGSPDNIKINDRGQFWVALNNGRSFPSFIDDIVAVRLDEHGRILERRHGNGFMQSISEVKEIRGTLFVGSVVCLRIPYFKSCSMQYAHRKSYSSGVMKREIPLVKFAIRLISQDTLTPSIVAISS